MFSPERPSLLRSWRFGASRLVLASALVALGGMSSLPAAAQWANQRSAPPPPASPAATPTAAAPPTARAPLAPRLSRSATVQQVVVEGAERLETSTILSYLRLGAGDEVDQDKLSDSLKALYASGLFADANLRMDCDRLIVSVQENPIVSVITFEGNDEIKTEDLEKEIQLKPRLVYTPARLQQDSARIQELYRRSGRFAARVTPKIVRKEQNRVEVIFEIVEGDKTGIATINFVGNRAFDAGDLRQVIATRETAWWRVFSSSDFYDPDRINFDRELLRKFYLNEGYVDVRVVASIAELTPDGEDFFVTFTIDEGPRYKVGKVQVASTLKDVTPESLQAQVALQAGDWYSAADLEKSINALTSELGNRQFAFAEVAPDLARNRETQTVDVTLGVREGARVYVNRVEIAGNLRTLDEVVRREILLAEGDPFNQARLRRSEQRVKDLGFFEEVKITPTPAAQPDQTNLEVAVKEKATGELSLGAGFSTTDGVLGDFSIRERNFLGRGQDVRVGATLSQKSQQYDFSFTEPYFMGRDLTAGVDVFRTARDNQDESSFDETNTGASLRFGYPLSEQLRQRWNYTLQQTEIDSVPSTASRFIREQQGERITSLVGQELSYDTRDSRLDPTTGMVLRLNTDLAGLGGDVDYARLKAGGTVYVPLADEWIVSVLGEAGQIYGLNGQSVRINDRFFLGGDNLRGFEFAGAGPRDLTNAVDDALGGERFARGTAELTFPSGLPNEVGLKFHLFSDVGTVGKLDLTPLPGEVIRSDERLRMSAGFGATWSSPFGPLRLDLAKAIRKEDYDKTQIFRFSFGTRF